MQTASTYDQEKRRTTDDTLIADILNAHFQLHVLTSTIFLYCSIGCYKSNYSGDNRSVRQSAILKYTFYGSLWVSKNAIFSSQHLRDKCPPHSCTN